jgi:hypothetical protein
MSSWMPGGFSISETKVFRADAEVYPGVRGHGLGATWPSYREGDRGSA